jgi:hypothetical protein
MMSWSRRAAQRGAGTVLMRPPPEHLAERRWHRVMTHLGERALQWQPGIEIWRGLEAERWTAEAAGDYGWQWLGLADAPAPLALPRQRA